MKDLDPEICAYGQLEEEKEKGQPIFNAHPRACFKFKKGVIIQASSVIEKREERDGGFGGGDHGRAERDFQE